MAYKTSELLSAGDLNRVVTIEAPVYGRPDEITGWSVVESGVRAGKKKVRGREAQDGGGEVSDQYVVWFMHYRSWLTTTHRIVHGADVWGIEDVDNVNEANRRLDVRVRLVK